MNSKTPDQGSSNKEKAELIDNLLADDHALVHLDGAIDGVALPPFLQGQAQVTLKISRLFKGGIEITDDKIIADLLFDGAYFCCHIPLSAVWGATSCSGAHTLWPDSAPKEVLAQILKMSIAGPQSASATPASGIRLSDKPAAKSVKAVSSKKKPASVKGGATSKNKKGTPAQLKRVK